MKKNFILIFIMLSIAFDVRASNLRSLIDIVDLNNDNSLDTIVGTLHNRRIKINYILWGKDTLASSEQTLYTKFDTTYIVYPSFLNIKTINNIGNYNLDTIPDIMIMIRGQIQDEDQLLDTIIRVVLYGQYGIDSLNSICISEIDSVYNLHPLKSRQISSIDFSCSTKRRYDFTQIFSFFKAPPISQPPTQRNFNIPLEIAVFTANTYPNPFSDHFFLRTTNLNEGIYILNIYDLNGDLLFQDKFNKTSNIEEYRINISNLPAGFYYLSVGGIDYNQTIKIIKQK